MQGELRGQGKRSRVEFKAGLDLLRNMVRADHERLRKLRSTGTELLIASHQPQDVLDLCDRAVWLEKRVVREYGQAEKVVYHYTSAHSEKRAVIPRARAIRAASVAQSGEMGDD